MASKKVSRTKPAPAQPITTSPEQPAPRARRAASKPAPEPAAAAPVAPVKAKAARPAAKTSKRPKAAASAEGVAVAPAAAPARQVTDDDIRLRAYFLSMEHRGRGSDIDFWLIAERELRARAKPQD